MLGDDRAFTLEQLPDLFLSQPRRFAVHAHIHTDEAVFGLVDQNGFLWRGGFLSHGIASAMCSVSLMRISPDNSLGRSMSRIFAKVSISREFDLIASNHASPTAAKDSQIESKGSISKKSASISACARCRPDVPLMLRIACSRNAGSRASR